MDLAEFFASRSIDGIDSEEWADILRGNSYGKYALTIGPGVIRIKDASGPLDNKIVKCVREYFTTDENGKKLRLSGSSKSLQCYKIKDELGLLNGVALCSCGDNCTSCHLACMRAMQEGRLHRVIKKKR